MQLHDDVIEIVTALGELMRAKINPKGSFSTVAEELALIETYLKIQAYRFSDKLTYKIIFDEDVANMYMMSLMLQPLVENAIIHGVECQENSCHLIITVKKKDGLLYCEVSDNGPGMSLETIQSIHEGQIRGIGITNIMHRLKLLFGEESKFSISSEIGMGTSIHLEIPLLVSEPSKGYPQ